MRDAAFSIKGNARACVFMEPLFAIPNTMYTGYMTLYMLALGMSKTQVGMVTSLGLAVHIFFAFISAYITDKMGRKYSTLIFDIIGWGVTQLIWALAQNIYFFVAAAVINAFGRVVMNSWMCLMLEDSPHETRIHIFTFMQFAGILAGFFTPVGALLINKLTLVPAMRVMLISGFVSMSVLFFVRHKFVTETAVGVQKQAEMKGVKIWTVFRAYIPAMQRIFSDRLLLIVLLVRTLNFIQLTIRTTFLSVLATERLGFPAEIMALYHTVNASIVLFSLIFIVPVFARYTRRWPITLGIWVHIAATVVLLLAPPDSNYPLLILNTVLVALGTSITTPRIDALVANTIVNEDRSVVNAMISIILLLISTPFGYIGGVLTGIDTRLPFLMILALFMICLLLLRVANILERKTANAADAENAANGTV